jgi:two-component system OmpR family sensor kinase
MAAIKKSAPSSSPSSLLWQISGLLLAVLLAVQGVSFAVLLLTPTPAAPRLSLATALAAIADPGAAAAAGVERQLQPAPPAGAEAGFVSAAAAKALGTNAGQVRAVWSGSEASGKSPVVMSVRIGDGSGAVRDGAVRKIDLQGGEAELTSPSILSPALADLPLPAFALALRQADGQWLTVRPLDPVWSLWRLRLLLAFAIGVLMLAPLAWFAARRIAGPVRALADAAARVDLDGQCQPLTIPGSAEIQAAAQAFNAMQARLREQAAERSRMVAAVAHDLRTPLTGLRLRAEGAGEPLRGRMVADIVRMNSMITQVLDYARGEEQTQQPKPQPLDLAELLRDCVAAAQEVQPQAALRCVAPESAPFVGDELGLHRAITNLIDNALRYAGAAELQLEAHNGAWLLTVQDRGPGVPEAELAHLTEPFRRLERSRSQATGGVGLGLAVVRRVALQHGGALVLSNRAGGGLQVALRLEQRIDVSRAQVLGKEKSGLSP